MGERDATLSQNSKLSSGHTGTSEPTTNSRMSDADWLSLITCVPFGSEIEFAVSELMDENRARHDSQE